KMESVPQPVRADFPLFRQDWNDLHILIKIYQALVNVLQHPARAALGNFGRIKGCRLEGHWLAKDIGCWSAVVLSAPSGRDGECDKHGVKVKFHLTIRVLAWGRKPTIKLCSVFLTYGFINTGCPIAIRGTTAASSIAIRSAF